MSQSSNQNEANLGSLLFGERSPMSLHVCLKPETGEGGALASLDPFEVINLGVGRRYVLAHLSMGKGFMAQFVLLNIYNPQSDSAAIEELATLEKYADDPRVPLPSIINFGESLAYSPTFYCGKTQVFFNVPCTVCATNLEVKSDSDYLHCPRCEELSQAEKICYSFYGDPIGETSIYDDTEHRVILLEDIFSLYASTPNLTTSMPCSGCEYSASCFPNAPKASGAVVNERHFIIPFSIESFSIYGFSYYPLNLIDYCELVSGKSKKDLLQALKDTGQTGRYRVLTESGNFSYQLAEHHYLTIQSPDLKWLLSVKLRVLMRICDALGKLGPEVNVSNITHNEMRMDVSQSYAAGDSFSRARLVLLCSNKVNLQWGEEKGEISFSLSDTLFFIFFKNKGSNELSLKIAIDSLIEIINTRRDISLQDLNEIILNEITLKSIFSKNKLLYDSALLPTTSGVERNGAECETLILMIVRLGVLLSKALNDGVFDVSINTVSQVITELKRIFVLVDSSINVEVTSPLELDVESDVLLSALNEIIEDESWLNSIFSSNTQVRAAVNDASDLCEQDDKTIIMTAKEDLDRTVILKNKTTDNVGNVESDDVMIMSSINRILRQL